MRLPVNTTNTKCNKSSGFNIVVFGIEYVNLAKQRRSYYFLSNSSLYMPNLSVALPQTICLKHKSVFIS